MSISWFSVAWAWVTGLFTFGTSPALSVVDSILDQVYDYYANIERVMSNIGKAHTGLVWVCDSLDFYAKAIPAPWMPYYSAIRNALCALRDLLADGKAERDEIVRVVESVKSAIAVWNE